MSMWIEWPYTHRSSYQCYSFDMELYVQQWNVFGVANKTHYSNNKIRLCQFYGTLTTHSLLCLSIFLTNTHKLVFRRLSPKMQQRQSTPHYIYLKQRARSSNYLLYLVPFRVVAVLVCHSSLSASLVFFFIFAVIVVVDVITVPITCE